jgi:nucleoside-diphosphate-sugar epimerase
VTKRAFVLGGTGLIGRAVGAAMARTGWSVSAASRGTTDAPPEFRPLDIRLVHLDRDRDLDLRAAVGEVEVMIDVVPLAAKHAEQLLELDGQIGSLIAVSSSAVYADEAGKPLVHGGGRPARDDPIPIDESQATLPPDDKTYAGQKVALEHALLAGQRAPVTIVRPACVYGPGDPEPREWYFVKRALDRRPYLILADRGSGRYHRVAAANVAQLVRLAAEQPGTRVLNSGDAEVRSLLDIARAVALLLEHEPIEVLLPGPPPVESVGATPWSVYRPFVLDMTAARDQLGYEDVSSFDTALEQTCEWLVNASSGRESRAVFPTLGPQLFDYTDEDRFLSSLRTLSSGTA